MNKQFKIVGIRTVKVYDSCSLEIEAPDTSTSEILLLEDEDKIKYELRFDNLYVDCYGGGLEIDVNFYTVKDFIGEKHYIPDNLRGYFIDLPFDEYGDIDIDEGYSCDIFSYYPSQDSYYPDAELNIDYTKFMRTIRYKYERVVYIFRGESGIGKSYLGAFVNQYEDIFETDKVNGKLPFEITENFIILGNKHNFTINDIIYRIPDKETCEIITVDFNQFKLDSSKKIGRAHV